MMDSSRGTGEFPLQAANLGKWDKVGERNREKDVWQSVSPVPVDTWKHRSGLPAITGTRGTEDRFECLLDLEAL